MSVDSILSRQKLDTIQAGSTIKVAVTVASFVALILFFYQFVPLQKHWQDFFRPAALLFLSGKSPYAVSAFHNPPWALVPLAPLAMLPAKLGSAMLSAITVFAYAFTAHRLGARGWMLVAWLLSPPAVWTYFQVNVDWLVSLGLLLPPQFSLFFVLIKPQLGAPLALFWSYQAYKKGGMPEVARLLLPVLIAFAASLVLYGPWPLRASILLDASHNRAMWPYSIPFGLLLLARAIRDNKAGYSLASAPLLAPYIGQSSLHIIALGLMPSKLETALVIAGLWVIFMVTGDPDIIGLLTLN